MNLVSRVGVLAFLLVGVCALSAQLRETARGIQVTWVDDDPKEPCGRFALNVSGKTVRAETECNLHSPYTPFWRFTPTESVAVSENDARRITSILEDPSFWKGSTVGTDTRSAGGKFQWLEIRAGFERALIVTSGNPSFTEPGVRRDLISLLSTLKARTKKPSAEQPAASTTASAPAGPIQTARGIEMKLVVSGGGFGSPSRLAVVHRNDQKTAASETFWGDDKLHHLFAPLGPAARSTVLTADESSQLIAALDNPEFWTGPIVGNDRTHADSSFIWLEVRSDNQRAVMVVSGNSSFADGPRRDLTALLRSIEQRLRSSPR
jgi:hypothetical protein